MCFVPPQIPQSLHPSCGILRAAENDGHQEKGDCYKSSTLKEDTEIRRVRKSSPCPRHPDQGDHRIRWSPCFRRWKCVQSSRFPEDCLCSAKWEHLSGRQNWKAALPGSLRFCLLLSLAAQHRSRRLQLRCWQVSRILKRSSWSLWEGAHLSLPW